MTPSGFELTLDDPRYPELLRHISDPPKTLYGRGDPTALSKQGLAIVGARRATPYGLEVTRVLATWAADSGYPVISGGAMGCDQAAHRAALAQGGLTVAVMAAGADIAYPATAGRLLDSICERGAVVSEQPWGTRPQKWMFRRRNRIVAGLAVAVLIAEAGLPSGTFATADEALAEGRDVLAVPGSVFSATSRGCNRLIRQGATPITDPSELRDALAGVLGPPAQESPFLTDLDTADADPVLLALRADPMRPDDAARALGMDVISVVRRLGRLEAAGLLRRYRDGRYGPGSDR